MNLGSFILENFALVDAADVDKLAKDVAFFMFLLLLALALVADRNAMNEGDEEPFLISWYSKSTPISAPLSKTTENVCTMQWKATTIDVTKQKHQEILRAVVVERALHAVLAASKEDVPFTEA